MGIFLFSIETNQCDSMGEITCLIFYHIIGVRLRLKESFLLS